ncbi:MAG: FoF1 ATP synthase subunit a [Candidatus Paceibacterota bacterium]
MIGIIRDITPIKSAEVFSLYGFTIANSTLFIMMISVIVLLFGVLVVRKFSLENPSRLQVATESVYLGAFDLIQNIINDENKTRKAFPVIGALMFYLIIANIIGLIPGLEQLTLNGEGVFRTPTSDFNTTFGIALAAIVIVNFISLKEKGILLYLEQFFKFGAVWKGFKKSIGDGFMAIIDFCIGLLDIVGEFTKVISLSLRLFGNMYAGQVLAVIIMGFFAVIVPSIWLAMNLFVGVLQAVVFASLVASYYMLATIEAEE